MNIVCVNTTDVGGGAESSAVNLNNALRELGHASVLLVGRKKGSGEDNILEIPRRLLIPVRKAMQGLHPAMARGLDRLSAIPNRLERLLGLEEFHHPGSRRILGVVPFKPDVLVFHNLHGKYFDLRALRNLSMQAPCVLILRDCWLLTGHCAYPKGCTRWKTGCGLCPDLSIYPAIGRDATALNWKRKKRTYDRSLLYLAAPSQWQIDRVHESMLSGRKYQVIPNAIDMNVFSPGSSEEARKRLHLPTNAQVIVFTAHSEFKDFETMFSAARLALRDRQDREMVFVCLGKDGAEHREHGGCIRFPGFVRDLQQLACYYRAADICLHAAYDETFGKSITEAMACGVPVIATKTGGIPEQITHGVNGFLVAPGDSSAMARTLSLLLQDPEQRNRTGERAHESARKYTFANQAAGFIEWFGEVIEDWALLRLSTRGKTHRSLGPSKEV